MLTLSWLVACVPAAAAGGMNSGAGVKRPAEGHPGQYVPRKRPPGDDDEFVEEDFELEPPEEEEEFGPDMEVRQCCGNWGEAGAPCAPHVLGLAAFPPHNRSPGWRV